MSDFPLLVVLFGTVKKRENRKNRKKFSSTVNAVDGNCGYRRAFISVFANSTTIHFTPSSINRRNDNVFTATEQQSTGNAFSSAPTVSSGLCAIPVTQRFPHTQLSFCVAFILSFFAPFVLPVCSDVPFRLRRIDYRTCSKCPFPETPVVLKADFWNRVKRPRLRLFIHSDSIYAQGDVKKYGRKNRNNNIFVKKKPQTIKMKTK